MDYFPLIFLLAGPLFIAGSVYVLVLRMSNPERMMKPLPYMDPGHSQVLEGFKDWLAARRYRYLTAFQFGSIKAYVFQEENVNRYFTFTFHQRITISMESRFDDVTFFESSNSGSLGMFPARPGAYRQSFPSAEADELWRRHLEGEEYLMRKLGLSWKPLSLPYQETLTNSLRMSMQYVRSIPFYPFRALYWFAVSRKKLANVPIARQYP